MLYLSFGKPPRHRVGDQVTVCELNGCMAERLDPVYRGVIVEKTRVVCHGAGGDGKIAAVKIRVTDPMKTGGKAGETKTELVDRMRLLEDERIVICR